MSIERKRGITMAVNEVSGVKQAKPERKVETRKDQTGKPLKCIFEDRNGDGKLDLYQITKTSPQYDGCTHEVTYTDNDGDGYFDSVREKVTCNLTDGKRRLSENDKTITTEFTEKNEATKMENVFNPQKMFEFLCKQIRGVANSNNDAIKRSTFHQAVYF